MQDTCVFNLCRWHWWTANVQGQRFLHQKLLCKRHICGLSIILVLRDTPLFEQAGPKFSEATKLWKAETSTFVAATVLPGHRGRVTAEKLPQCETRNSLGNPEKLLVSQMLCPCEIPMKNSFPGRGHSQLNCPVSCVEVCLFLSLLVEVESSSCYSELLGLSVSLTSAPWIAETTFSPTCPAVFGVLKGPSTLTWNTEENA